MAAGKERNFVQSSRSHMEVIVLATSKRFLAMKPPPFPMLSTSVAMSSDAVAWKSRTFLSPGMPFKRDGRGTAVRF